MYGPDSRRRPPDGPDHPLMERGRHMTVTSDDTQNPALSDFQRRFAAKIEDEKQSKRSKLEPTAVPGFEQRFATRSPRRSGNAVNGTRQRRQSGPSSGLRHREPPIREEAATRRLQACRSTAPGDQWIEGNRTRMTIGTLRCMDLV